MTDETGWTGQSAWTGWTGRTGPEWARVWRRRMQERRRGREMEGIGSEQESVGRESLERWESELREEHAVYSAVLKLEHELDSRMLVLERAAREMAVRKCSTCVPLVKAGTDAGLCTSYRLLRVHVLSSMSLQHTPSNAPGSVDAGGDPPEPLAHGAEDEPKQPQRTWTLRVCGGVFMPDRVTPDTKRSFMGCVRRLEIATDALGSRFEWMRAREPAKYSNRMHHIEGPEGDADGVDLTRQVPDSAFNVRIEITPHAEVVTRFKLSEQIQLLLGCDVASRAIVKSAVWNYIRLRKLLVNDGTPRVLVDDYIAALFTGAHKITADRQASNSPSKSAASPAVKPVKPPKFLPLSGMQGIIDPHLSPLPGLVLDVRVDPDGPPQEICYDLRLDIDEFHEEHAQISSSLLDVSRADQDVLDRNNHDYGLAVRDIMKKRQRRRFFESFSRAPHSAVVKILQDQARELELMDTHRLDRVHQNSKFYQKRWVHEAIPRYLIRKALHMKGPAQ
ncbi:SWI/SNF complex component SNF12-like [Porphyridium purpureum]|uniref:SWI/SNF complex component SNF12-like n=1 Tax=Porphyridium purpureum TaxID=35688 RepID=A0A5J4YYG8_PORPP|nr:SWI/SNF complex component SNF12-like [Porphyridium purpureum]|eukprot:POR6655..scf209_3